MDHYKQNPKLFFWYWEILFEKLKLALKISIFDFYHINQVLPSNLRLGYLKFLICLLLFHILLNKYEELYFALKHSVLVKGRPENNKL